MKKKIILPLLFSFSLIVSCKNSTQTSNKINLPFDARPFSVNNTSFNDSTLRKKLLHEIYLAQKALRPADAEKIISDDLEDIKDDANYNKNFSKLIVSFADREELYYIPESTNKNDLFSALSLKLEPGKTWVWKSEIKKRQTAYLIETSSAEVLKNEKFFSVTAVNSLDTIYPFQTIEISLQVLMAIPTYVGESSNVKIPRCLNGENPEQCWCDYARTIPSGGYSSYTNISRTSQGAVLLINQSQQQITFHEESGVLKSIISADANQSEAKKFKIELPANSGFQFISVANNCKKYIPDQAFNLINKFQYKMEFKVVGASETLDGFGTLPKQVE